MVVVDPPFITEEVWTKYADACSLLLEAGVVYLFIWEKIHCNWLS